MYLTGWGQKEQTNSVWWSGRLRPDLPTNGSVSFRDYYVDDDCLMINEQDWSNPDCVFSIFYGNSDANGNLDDCNSNHRSVNLNNTIIEVYPVPTTCARMNGSELSEVDFNTWEIIGSCPWSL